MIYFHGNAEDIGLAMELLSFVKDMMKVSLHSPLTRLSSIRCMFLQWSTLATVSTRANQIQTKSVWMHKTFMII